eukprot:m.18946 g.18946  ORF g.18946 m.18946 type:complete len:489 (-) comp7470_c0_seq1:140-1606(-)
MSAANLTYLTQTSANLTYLPRSEAQRTYIQALLPVWITNASAFVFPLVGTAYTFTLQASDPSYITSTMSFSIITGTLPSGLTLDPNLGRITGTSSDTANRNITFRVTTSYGLSSDLVVPFFAAISRPVWSAAVNTILYPVSGVAYTVTLSATDTSRAGATPTYTLLSALPTGLTFNPITCTISGTTTDTTNRNVVIRATSNVGNAFLDVTIASFRALTLQFMTFTTGTTTWTAPAGINNISALVVGGGGAGSIDHGGGGGAGGVVFLQSLAVSPGQVFTVTVGAGGVGVRGSHIISQTPQGGISSRVFGPAASGSSSVFGTFVASGGGGGSAFSTTVAAPNGGCGGGAGAAASGAGVNGGTSTQATYAGALTYGTSGGATSSPVGGGGGGAGGAGAATSGNGGAGIVLFGRSIAGGGGGGGHSSGGFGTASHGGGAGCGSTLGGDAGDGAANTGGGGGGAYNNAATTGATGIKAGNGGSGLVMLQYFQ